MNELEQYSLKKLDMLMKKERSFGMLENLQKHLNIQSGVNSKA